MMECDDEISDLCTEVLFLYCTPSTSVAFSSMDTEIKDNAEVLLIINCMY